MRNRERNRLAVMALVAATTLATPLAGARVDAPASSRAGDAPDYREVTIPAGTALRIDLRTSVGSDTSRVEQRVTAALRAPVSVHGAQALPAGTRLLGRVTSVNAPFGSRAGARSRSGSRR